MEVSNEEKKLIRNKYEIPENAIVFIYGGNLGKPQGIDFLIKVLESNLNREDIFFVVAGAGTEFNNLNKWFKSKDPSNAILLSGLPKKEYDKLLQSCDIGLIFLDKRFTIPNFPSRLLAYLENKMPVLAATDTSTDIGNIIEEAKCGYWCVSNDLESFNKILNHFVNNNNLIKDMGNNSYRLLKEKYTIDVSYSTIVKKMIKGPETNSFK
jgi:glycosyltransferase involved in cell wall biosynthesis